MYFGTVKFSTAQRVNRMNTIGHLIRGDTRYAEVAQWTPPGEDHRRKVLSERCAADAGVETVHDMIDAANDRRRWRRLTEQLKEKLEPVASFVPVTDPTWPATVKRVQTLADMQFVEEGRSPYPLLQGALHIYTDGGMREVKHKNGSIAKCAGYGVVFFTLRNQPGFNLTEVCNELVNEDDMTNNRAEISAAIVAVKRSANWTGDVAVHTDSEIVWSWAHTQRRRYLLDQYNVLQNADLWLVLNAAIGERLVHFVKVRSHNGNPRNDEVDSLATRALGYSLGLRYPGEKFKPFDTSVHVKTLSLERHLAVQRAKTTCLREEARPRSAIRIEDLKAAAGKWVGNELAIVTWRFPGEGEQVSEGYVVKQGRSTFINYHRHGVLPFPNPEVEVVCVEIKMELSQ
jgi:ribonuclease HI